MATPTTIIVPIANDTNVAWPEKNIPAIAIMTVKPEMSTARPEVAAHWVPQITSGEGIVGIGLSEPHAGSDAGNPRLRAEQDRSADRMVGDDELGPDEGARRRCGGDRVRADVQAGDHADAFMRSSRICRSGKNETNKQGMKEVAHNRLALKD